MAASPRTAPVIALRSRADVVGTVPWLLGFRPEESLVVLSLRGPRRTLGLTMRVDLPPPGAERAVVDELARRVRGDGAGAVVLACYSAVPDDLRGLPGRALVRRLMARLGRDASRARRPSSSVAAAGGPTCAVRRAVRGRAPRWRLT